MIQEVAPRTATLVWDRDSITPKMIGTVFIWDGYPTNSNSRNSISLASEVESRSDAIREQILAFVYQVGIRRIGKQTVIETLEVRESFSWWWMTFFALRRWHVNSNLFELARLYALHGLLVEHQIDELAVIESTKQMETSLNSLCESLGVTVHFLGTRRNPKRDRIRRICIPKPALALATLIKEIAWSLCLKTQPAPVNEGGTCFFDYFSGLDLDELEKGKHRSRFWGPISQMAESRSTPNLWFHVFSPTAELPTLCKAQHALISSRPEISDNHRILARRLNFRIIGRALSIYMKIFWRSFRITRTTQLFVNQEAGFDVEDLFWDEWIDSLRGKSAMHHALLFCTIEETVSSLSKQRAAFFIMENQPWEIALQYAWRTSQMSPIIGVPHAAAKFWELRHFIDPRSRRESGIQKFPEPDRIAINSCQMRQLLESNGVAINHLIDVEAASYAHLASLKSSDSSFTTNDTDSIRILILGDYDVELTTVLLNALDEASKILELKIEKLFRSHPMCLISQERLDKSGLKTNQRQIAEQFANSDVVVTTSTTSAAVEAYCLGIPVIIYLSASTFNFSPLRHEMGVFFATNPNELADQFSAAVKIGRQNHKTYFNTDPAFPIWRQLLNHP